MIDDTFVTSCHNLFSVRESISFFGYRASSFVVITLKKEAATSGRAI